MKSPSSIRSVVLSAQVAIVVAVVAAWQFLPETVLDELLWSRPDQVWDQFVAWAADGTLLWNAIDTLFSVTLGLLLGCAAGVAIGMLAGLAPRIGNLLYAPIQTLFALPKITLVPLFILWFGVSTFQHVMFTSVVVFFFFFFAVFSGVRGTSQALKNAFVLMGASRWQRIRFLILPSCLGWIALALKLALPYAFVAAISAEVVASTSGLGNLVKTSAQVMNAAGVFASLIALLCISLMCSFIANRAASHFARYNQ